MRGKDSAFSLSLAVAACAGALSGCVSSLGGHLRGSPAIGAAEGQVRFRRTPADNVAISLSIKHLPEPEKLEPPAWAYVAWIRSSKDSPPLNLGPLNVGKDSKGELKTVTQLRTFELFVTAEPTAAVEHPSGEPLLWTTRYE